MLRVTRMHSSRMCTTRSNSHLLGGSALVYAGLHTPGPGSGPGDPPGVGLETPLGCGPGDLPPGVGLRPPRCGPGDPRQVWAWKPPSPSQTPQLYPWVWAWRPRPPPPAWTEFLTHASENITLNQLHCGR